MKDIKEIYNSPFQPITKFNYWFIRDNKGILNVYSMENLADCLGTMEESVFQQAEGKTLPTGGVDRLLEDFVNFMYSRPEYFVGLPVEDLTQESYERLLLGCFLIRALEDNKTQLQEKVYVDLNTVDQQLDNALRCIKWLRGTDFFQAPASTRYHESFVGGLCSHTLSVVNCIIDLIHCDNFKRVKLHQAVLTALVHDWCKIGNYESYKKNVKHQDTGNWSQVDAFKRREHTYSALGHGVSSMYLAARFVNLSYEECLAIRWHMGHWRVTNDEVSELQQANETFPLVHLLQFADQLSIVNF